jgi:hypothetical protein
MHGNTNVKKYNIITFPCMTSFFWRSNENYWLTKEEVLAHLAVLRSFALYLSNLFKIKIMNIFSDIYINIKFSPKEKHTAFTCKWKRHIILSLGSFLTDATTHNRQAVRAVLAAKQLNLYLKRVFLTQRERLKGIMKTMSRVYRPAETGNLDPQNMDKKYWQLYRSADKSLARPGRKQATVTEEFDINISYL